MRPAFSLRFDPPYKYNGTTDFEDWPNRLTSYLCLESDRYQKIFEDYENYYSMIQIPSDTDLTTRYDDGLLIEPHLKSLHP